jgi:ATP-dependent RNA helicase TDRD9
MVSQVVVKLLRYANKTQSILEQLSFVYLMCVLFCYFQIQVPQFILDQHYEKEKICNIVVTQPRKIAAISVARRVCDERNWKLGQVVGYQV